MARIDHARYALEDETPLWFGGIAAGGVGRNNIYGTAGDDRLHGTAGGDNFHVEQGGDDRLLGGAGDDKFFFGSTYTDSDVVYGGDGFDRLILGGTTQSHLTLGPDNLRGIEAIKLTGGDYDFTLLDGIPDLRIWVFNRSSNLNVDASQVTSANVTVLGGPNQDVLVGGSGNDRLIGNSGPDRLTGGAGQDTFKYVSPSDSTERFSQSPDTIMDIERGDRVILPTATTEVLQYHIGSTNEHIGDIVAVFDLTTQITRLDVYTDRDNLIDMTVFLIGDHMNFQIHDAATIVF